MPTNRDYAMKRIMLLLMTLTSLCSCGKDLSVSEKYIGAWEGILYMITDYEGGERKVAIVTDMIELTIDKSSSYTCIIYQIQFWAGIPIKGSVVSISKGNVIEVGESISFSNTFRDNIFTPEYYSVKYKDGLLLTSSEYMIEMGKL